MPDLFGVDIAGEIASGFAGLLRAGTLTRKTAGTRGANLTGGTNPTSTAVAIEGFMENTTEKRMGGSLASEHGMFMTILGKGGDLDGTNPPKKGDMATLTGEPGTWTLGELVERDPAGATYKFEVSK